MDNKVVAKNLRSLVFTFLLLFSSFFSDRERTIQFSNSKHVEYRVVCGVLWVSDDEYEWKNMLFYSEIGQVAKKEDKSIKLILITIKITYSQSRLILSDFTKNKQVKYFKLRKQIISLLSVNFKNIHFPYMLVISC